MSKSICPQRVLKQAIRLITIVQDRPHNLTEDELQDIEYCVDDLNTLVKCLPNWVIMLKGDGS